MSQHRKPRRTPAASRNAAAAPASNQVAGSAKVFSPATALQLLAIIGLSCALGFTFNAASPVGIELGNRLRTDLATRHPPAQTNRVDSNSAAAAAPTPSVVTNPPVVLSSGNPPAAHPHSTVLSNATPAALNSSVAANPTHAAAVNPPSATNIIAAPAVPLPTPIHWLEAKAMAADGKAVLVDVRLKAMYDAGHIPGATSLPELSPATDFTSFLMQLPTDMVVIVYCSSTSCSQSARVATRLVNEFQWPAVRYMTGGYQEYQQAELAKPASPPSS